MCEQPRSTVHIVMKLLKLQPYKTTVIHSLTLRIAKQEHDMVGGLRN
jgi:hypothetical protein